VYERKLITAVPIDCKLGSKYTTCKKCKQRKVQFTKILIVNKGLFIKDIRSQGEGGFVQCGHFSDKGILQMRTSALFGAKYFGYFEIYGMSARTRENEVEPVRIFCDQVKGVNLLRFCADAFYGRPLKNINKKIRKPFNHTSNFDRMSAKVEIPKARDRRLPELSNCENLISFCLFIYLFCFACKKVGNPLESSLSCDIKKSG